MRLRGMVLDWAGTTVDYGCMAPVQAFMEVFRSLGLEPTMEEVRAPMGLLKWDHIKTMLEMPRISRQFEERMGRSFTDEDVDRIHELFEPKLLGSLERFSHPMASVVEIVERLRADGMKIGATTGYTDTMMRIVAETARKDGYEPDCWITPDSVGGKGRPYPYMIYTNMIRLDMGLPIQVVKVGDTASDMQEARNAGVWAIGILKGSSMLGLSEEETASMPASDLEALLEKAKRQYIEQGAHDVVEIFSQLPDAVERINRRLLAGERP
ncbi:phosphonoacetaldehyde hydrolase [Cohnella phaseoli]|uniref:Phosphonoacetaldehyde hydrolase n=1 Tax=Cohnella phaseoli TaxID=456490 RepID=A0A3D9KHC3_9BACL|nr:phosphonoacetaldehyde hydrolase [Cohnella phaseoli]RED85562.1 phosphonoacetaldehyde hydrolase [Cohnella phaseoli]